MNHSEIVAFLWGLADLIRDTFKRGKYQDVILPLTVLRRLDCVLAPTKGEVLSAQARFKDKLDNPDSQLRKASGFAFYNTSRYDFEKLLADAPHLAENLRNYIAGFSANMRDVLEKFDFDNTISTLDEVVRLILKVRRCQTPSCHRYHRPYRPEEEGRWALPGHEFGLDIVAQMGLGAIEGTAQCRRYTLICNVARCRSVSAVSQTCWRATMSW